MAVAVLLSLPRRRGVSTRLDSGTATVQGLRVQVHQGEGLLCGIF
jgi:hypothetical protein